MGGFQSDAANKRQFDQVAKVDPKVSADQRGHGIGVSLDVYTKSNIRQKGVAAKKLEDSVLGRKVVRMPKQKAS